MAFCCPVIHEIREFLHHPHHHFNLRICFGVPTLHPTAHLTRGNHHPYRQLASCRGAVERDACCKISALTCSTDCAQEFVVDMTSECKSVAVVYASSEMARSTAQEVPRTE